MIMEIYGPLQPSILIYKEFKFFSRTYVYTSLIWGPKLHTSKIDKTISRLFYNLGQNIWNKREKSSKTGQGKKSLIYTFPCLLTAIAKVKFLGRRLVTRL